jgi:hypothetical protein
MQSGEDEDADDHVDAAIGDVGRWSSGIGDVPDGRCDALGVASGIALRIVRSVPPH